jgi:penicillin-binding protein 1B
MTSGLRAVVLAASTVFLIASTAVQVGFASLYSDGVSRLLAELDIRLPDARVLARPIPLRAGDPIARQRVEEHLRGIGFYEGPFRDRGCFTIAGNSLTIWSRDPVLPDVTLEWAGGTIARVTTPGGQFLDGALIEPETILTVSHGPDGAASRTSHYPIPYSALAGTPLLDAIIASEDGRFRAHHGVDLWRLALTPFIAGGGSTITMQLARMNILKDRSRTVRRKVTEIGIAMAIERGHSKDAIVSAYVDAVYAGVSRGRLVHGIGAGSREFFGVDDVRRLTPLQAATLAALLNQPSRYLGDLQNGDDGRLRRQRNRVLRLMHRNFPEVYPAAWVRDSETRPAALQKVGATVEPLEALSRYFLEYAAGGAARAGRHTYLTLDADLQRIAAETVERGLLDLEARLPGARGRLQASLVATNPRTGEVLAMIGGRSYRASQFNRAVYGRRQIGSVLKPFAYLAALERAAAEGRGDLSADTIVLDVPTVFRFPGTRPWAPANYGGHYAGPVTWRRALAESRNVPAVKIAALAGFPRVAKLWEASSGQTLPGVFPSIALGAVEATPLEVARAYAIFATGGEVRPLRTLAYPTGRVAAPQSAVRVAAPDTVAAVTGMLRAVVDEGTARSARTAGLTMEIAGKTGTTDGLRDAWFVGFSSDLLAVVWIGCDDDRPLGLTGAQGALPVWVDFMKRASERRW